MYSNQELDILSIGNAIVDVLSHVKDNVLEHLGLEKNTMTLIRLEDSDRLYPHMSAIIARSGGSAANTAAAFAALGGKAGYVGRVKNDQFGKIFAQDLQSLGVEYLTPLSKEGSETGRCLVFVTPDSKRTMQTYLGSCVELSPQDLDPEQVMRAKITYLEGYAWDSPTAKATCELAAKVAKQAGRKVAITLSDHNLVDRHRNSFSSFIKESADIVFANENEILALCETSSLDNALDSIQGVAELVIVTLSEKGSIILTSTARIHIPAERVLNVVDSTGAGDFYAAGFLFGLTQKHSLEMCGNLASLCGAHVIQYLGARPDEDLISLIA